MIKIKREFYNRDTLIVAKDLLGKILVHEADGHKICGRIIETEAYMGAEDKAAHSYGWKRTKRLEVLYGDPGFSYIYMIYGMYFCFNAVTREKGIPQAVLVRALQPLEGLEDMAQNRFKKSYTELTKAQIRGISNGPGKLCRTLALDKNQNELDLCGNRLYITDDGYKDFKIAEAKRIGIDYAEEAADYPWRFYINGSDYVSVK